MESTQEGYMWSRQSYPYQIMTIHLFSRHLKIITWFVIPSSFEQFSRIRAFLLMLITTIPICELKPQNWSKIFNASPIQHQNLIGQNLLPPPPCFLNQSHFCFFLLFHLIFRPGKGEAKGGKNHWPNEKIDALWSSPSHHHSDYPKSSSSSLSHQHLVTGEISSKWWFFCIEQMEGNWKSMNKQANNWKTNGYILNI